MAEYSYLSRDRFKLDLADTATTDDAKYRRVLEAVTEQIDHYLGRTFRIHQATKVYTARDGACLDLPDDLLTVTTLKTDEGSDLTYEITWTANTDYELYPYNASQERQPYWRILKRPNGSYSFPVAVPQGVQIVGKWGYWQELETLVSQVGAAGISSSAVTLPVDDGTEVDVLDTLLIGTEQLYVTAISANNCTVVRGVNGTTAAAHLDNDPIYRYRYPGPVSEACGLQASRYFLRKGAPFGVVGSADAGFIRLQNRLDPDVQLMLSPYRLMPVA